MNPHATSRALTWACLLSAAGACTGDDGQATSAVEATESAAGSTDVGTSLDSTSAGASESGDTSTGCRPPVAQPALPCEGNTPFMFSGLNTPVEGWFVCDSGLLHRSEAVACALPEGGCDPFIGGDEVECLTDAECTDAPNGRCSQNQGFSPECECLYACEVDADCGDGQACFCFGIRSACIPAECRTDADCGEGQACRIDDSDPSCGPTASARMACTTEADSCHSPADCEGDSVCSTNAGDACGFGCSPNPYGCADG